MPWRGRDATDHTGDHTGDRFVARIQTDHGGPLRSYLRHRWRDVDQVEDMMQEVLLRAWRTQRSLPAPGTDDGRLRRWLLTTAHNVLVDRWRHERRRPLSPVDQDDLIALAPTAAPLDRAVDGWLVRQALARLSRDHRAVVVELYYQGRSVAEAATVLGIAEGTVKSRSYHAVRALRSIFDELGVTR